MIARPRASSKPGTDVVDGDTDGRLNEAIGVEGAFNSFLGTNKQARLAAGRRGRGDGQKQDRKKKKGLGAGPGSPDCVSPRGRTKSVAGGVVLCLCSVESAAVQWPCSGSCGTLQVRDKRLGGGEAVDRWF